MRADANGGDDMPDVQKSLHEGNAKNGAKKEARVSGRVALRVCGVRLRISKV